MSEWDLWLLFQINREWTHPFLDWFMPAISTISAWTPVIAFLVLMVIWRRGKRGLLLVSGLVLAVVVSDCLVSYPLKTTVKRQRPTDSVLGVKVRSLARAKPDFVRLFLAPVERDSVMKSLSDEQNSTVVGNSFPSSHTMNMFAVATVLAFYRRRFGGWMYVLAALVSYSRIYVGSHWPSDIPPSMGLGILVGLAVAAIMQYVSRRCLAI